MKKKTYVKPVLNSEEFVPQEYIAACWIVSCDVPQGSGYNETNGVEGCQTKAKYKGRGKHKVKVYDADELILANVSGCGTKHKGVMSDKVPEPNCYWVPIFGKEPKEFNCFYWYQEVGHGHFPQHFSTLQWEPVTNPNAS